MPWFVVLALFVASFALSALLTPKPETPKPATLEEFEVPQWEEGTPQAWPFGDVWLQGWMVGWYGNLKTYEINAEGKK